MTIKNAGLTSKLFKLNYKKFDLTKYKLYNKFGYVLRPTTILKK